MKIEIKIINENAQKQIVHLKKYIESKRIDTLEHVEINKSALMNGQMSSGTFLDSITLLISSAQTPISELVKCLQIYIQNFKTEIHIKNENGRELTLSSSKLDEISIQKIITTFLKN